MLPVALAVSVKSLSTSAVVSPTMVRAKVPESAPVAKVTVPVTAEKSPATVVPWFTVQVTVVSAVSSAPVRVMV